MKTGTKRVIKPTKSTSSTMQIGKHVN